MKQQKLLSRRFALALALSLISLGLLIGSARTLSSNQKQSQQSQQGAIYTDAQAARGQAVFDKKCASCHGLRLEGGSASALSGGKFADRWARGDKSVDDLYYITRTQMPFGAGNTLSKQQYIDTVAYMLKANGYKAGARELPADPAFLKQIKIETQGSLKEGFIQSQAESEAGASPSANGAKAAPDPPSKGPFNMAPMIFEDLILLGLGISEQGVKGWVGAFKLETGEPVWRFNTVPDDGEPGAETWGKPDVRKRGGGAVWAPLSLDSQAGLVYVPVANPAPDFLADVRPGSNLYTNSLVVLDVRTGKLQWHHQTTPSDTHDWDLTQVSPLFTTTVGGKTRKLVALAGKDGLLHALDRETKEHLYATPVTTRSNADEPLTVKGVHACPGVLGGVLWNGPAYNPNANMLYTPAVDWCGVFKKAEEDRFIPGQLYMGGMYIDDPIEKSRGWLTAVDASTGKVAWRYESSKPMLAAVATTSAGLIFTGEMTGDFLTLDARTGKELYRFNTGGPMNGGVVTYAINGKQYVAAASGSASGFWRAAPGSSTIIIFSLPELARSRAGK